MIVVDVGCAPQGNDESICKLIERFQPASLIGFDPLLFHTDLSRYEGLLVVESPSGRPVAAAGRICDTEVALAPEAAWTRGGYLSLSAPTGIVATVMPESTVWDAAAVELVPCFDLAAWLNGYGALAAASGDIVVKIDAEGAEFPLLERMLATGTDQIVSLVLVEWHDRYLDGYQERRERLVRDLRCPVEEWA